MTKSATSNGAPERVKAARFRLEELRDLRAKTQRTRTQIRQAAEGRDFTAEEARNLAKLNNTVQELDAAIAEEQGNERAALAGLGGGSQPGRLGQGPRTRRTVRLPAAMAGRSPRTV